MGVEKNQEHSEVRFIADTMLGRLAKWLRILGYDTLYPGQETDHRLAKIAADDVRVLLTRDVELAARKGFQKLLIHSNELSEQLAQVIEAFDLKTNDRTLSLCLLCNRSLSEIGKEQAQGKVPTYVYQTQPRFHQCSSCGKIYWAGTHLEHIRNELKKLGINM